MKLSTNEMLIVGSGIGLAAIGITAYVLSKPAAPAGTTAAITIPSGNGGIAPIPTVNLPPATTDAGT